MYRDVQNVVKSIGLHKSSSKPWILKKTQSNHDEKSGQKDANAARASCSKAEPKIFAPPQTPFPGTQDGQNLITWRWSLPLPTNPVWLGSMHANSSYHGNRPTNTYTHTSKQTHRQDRLQYTASL